MEKQLKGLIVLLRVFGGLSIIFGALTILASVTSPESAFVSAFLLLISGILYWVIAKGLSKKEKWAWYLGLVVFVYSAAHNFLVGEPVNLMAGGLAVLFIIILLTSKKTFFAPQVNE